MDAPITNPPPAPPGVPAHPRGVGGATSLPHGAASQDAGGSARGPEERPTRFAGLFGLRPGLPSRLRALSLHGPRILMLATGMTSLAAILTSALLWTSFEHAAQREATDAMRFVDQRLNEIETDMRSVARQAEAYREWSTCMPALASLLARASIASENIKQFELSEAGRASSCQPDGRSTAPLYEHRAGGRLSLTSTGEILSRLTATLPADANDRVIGAVLDPRAFEPQQGHPDSWLFTSRSRLTLESGDGRPLTVLGVARRSSTAEPALRRIVRSTYGSVAVAAEMDREIVISAMSRWIMVCLGLTLTLLIGVVALSWRRAQQRARLFHRIERGLRRREFEPFVQPIIDLRTGRCAGAEVLMRWAHPQRGIVGPAEFIEEAERTGLIVGMSDLVMTRAAHRLGPIAERFPDLYFSFNLTPHELGLARLPKRLAEIFRADTLPRDRVLLELTEREFVDPLAMNSLRALQDDGWRIAIDDFGTGHSSLGALERMTIDRLKIDRTFVSTIREETVSRPVLDAIIQLADRLEVPMIAEGIETHAQWQYLAERGVQYAQGFLIGRPMPIAAFHEWLTIQERTTPTSVATVGSSTAPELPVPDVAAQQLWNAMRTPGGLDIRDRMFRLRTYPQCFVGREAVDWLVQHQRVSREEAVRIGKRLSALGLLSHVVDEHDFEDAELFYRLATPRGASLVAGPAAEGLRASLRGARGVPLREHARGILRHRDCATGRAIVNWIMETRQVSREMATRWALQLMREGGLRHVYDDAPFRDDRTLYRIA